jgi:hypothetical protein
MDMRWNVTVSQETDRDLRAYLAQKGGKGELSRFVEEAVQEQLFWDAVAESHEANADLSAEEAEALAEEAVRWARQHA